MTAPTGGLAVANVGLPRMIYYLDSSGAIRELNNSLQYPNEVWMEDVTSTGTTNSGNSGVEADSSQAVGPVGMVVGKGMSNTKLAMAAGFRGKLQEIWLFYQQNGTDVSVQMRDADSAGQWSEPSGIPVALS